MAFLWVWYKSVDFSSVSQPCAGRPFEIAMPPCGHENYSDRDHYPLHSLSANTMYTRFPFQVSYCGSTYFGLISHVGTLTMIMTLYSRAGRYAATSKKALSQGSSRLFGHFITFNI